MLFGIYGVRLNDSTHCAGSRHRFGDTRKPHACWWRYYSTATQCDLKTDLVYLKFVWVKFAMRDCLAPSLGLGWTWGLTIGPIDSPPKGRQWVRISAPLTHMTYLLPCLIYLASSFSFPSTLPPVRPGYDDN